MQELDKNQTIKRQAQNKIKTRNRQELEKYQTRTRQDTDKNQTRTRQKQNQEANPNYITLHYFDLHHSFPVFKENC